MIARRHLLLACPAALLSALAANPVAAGGGSDVYQVDGIALGGADPVAYFAEGRAMQGTPDHALKWRGAIWYFASEEHRLAFEMNPRAYAPRYGGFCAYAVARGHTAPIDPDAWAIHDGNLYLLYDTDVLALWKQDLATEVADADANWPGVLH